MRDNLIKKLYHRAHRKLYKVRGIDRYHLDQRLVALRSLEKVESEKGKLERHLRSQCDAYAQDVLGSKLYAPWLYVYSAVAGTFKEGWIPNNYYGLIVRPMINSRYGSASGMRGLNRLFFNSDLFPDIASQINGSFFDPYGQIIPKEQIVEKLFSDRDRVVFKQDVLARGTGIHFFRRSEFCVDTVASLGDGLFQSCIEQDGGLARFSSTAVSTLRVTTATDERGSPSIRGAHLRLGEQGDTHIRNESQIRVPVDLKDGRMSETGYLPDWTTTTRHPSNGETFAGFFYPRFREVCEASLKLHAKVPFVRCIGWDFCVDQSGAVKAMEWNGGHNGIVFAEATQGPCFRDLNWERFVRQ